MNLNLSKKTLSLGLTLAICALPLAAAQAAGTPDQSCRAVKLKTAGKYSKALLGCYAKAATDGSMPDGECLSKAAGKMTDGFSAADSKGDSTCSGLILTSSGAVEALPPAVESAAPVASGGGKCPSGIDKAAGKLAASELGAWSKFVTSGDAVKRDDSITKAQGKFASSMTKAEEEDGCTASGQTAAVQLAVEDGIEPLIACIAGTGSCSEEVAAPGDTVTTDPDGSGPDVDEPLAASVQTPVAGTVTLHVVDATDPPPVGYSILGQVVEITAPASTASAPLVLTFTIDASLLPVDPLSVEVTRNGVLVDDCSGAPGVASPDPCVQSRTVLPNGDLQIVSLSSQASEWAMLLVTGPTTTTTTTTLPGGDYWMRWETRADKVGSDVATEIDIGWTGITHDIDPVDGAPLRFKLDCPLASLPSYGDCTVTGFDPADDNCRCSNNTATICDQPLSADADDCGGATCNCYTRPPLHSVNGGTPVCLVGTASADASGSWNPDTGSGDVTVSEVMRLFIGIEIEKPCPVCVGDATANDGARGGTCDGGQTSGAACDASGTDPSYPRPTGGSTSLDCLPSLANNVSGAGLKFTHVESTSPASLSSGMPCAFNPGENCPCAACSSDTTRGCASNAECLAATGPTCSLDPTESCTINSDCAAVDEGTCHAVFEFCTGAMAVSCTTNDDCTAADVGPCVDPTCDAVGGTGETPQPNSCSGTCDVGVDGEASCSNPSQSYCDGFVEEDGKGVISCLVDSDCDGHGPWAGDCTIDVASDCFPATITATGVADPDSPRTVSTLCVAGTSSGSVNAASGLPGPARLRSDWNVTYGEQ